MPIEQQGNSLTARAHYTNSGANATGLTVTASVYNPAGTKVVTAASATEIGDGIYQYALDSSNVTSDGPYTWVFDTAGTVDQRNVAGQWLVGVAGVERLDAAVSSRSTLTAANVWAYLSASATTAGSIGKRIVDYLTGDIFARLGDPSGSSISADIAAVTAPSVSDILGANVPSNHGSGTLGGVIGRIGRWNVELRTPFVASDKLQIVMGDDYKAADSRSLDWPLEGLPDLTGATVKMAVQSETTLVTFLTGSVVDPGAAVQTIRIEPDADETVLLDTGTHHFDVEVETAAGNKLTVVRGQVEVLKGYVT